MKINLHSHTQFCDGKSTMEEMLLSARSAGFNIWGFTPHGPINVDSPCNMKGVDVNHYLEEIERLRPLFPEIKILAGMEIDYIDKKNGPHSSYVKGYGLDYIIGSIHFIPNQKNEFHDIDGSPERFKNTLQNHFDNDLNYIVETFWQQTHDMIEAGGFDLIGHIDKIALNASFINPGIEQNSHYLQLANDTINLAINKGLAVEINTKHFKKYGRFFPHQRFWPHIIRAGIPAPINSDAHYAHLVEAGITEAKVVWDKLKGKIE